MSGPPGFLEFFILEASDYVEQLDRLLPGGDSSSLDAASMQRIARALRGTATMAKLPSFAELASGVERAGRAVQDGFVPWTPALGGALVAAIDDLKTLLHAARTWSPADDERATRRAAELAELVPAAAHPALRPQSRADASGAGSDFLAAEAANVAAGVELVRRRPQDAATVANVLHRVRALRGVTGVAEIRPLADALESTEEALAGLNAGAPMADDAQRMLDAATTYLRTVAAALNTGSHPNAADPAGAEFAAARDDWSARTEARDIVVPVSALFYAGDASGLMHAAPDPPTSASQRFRLELIGLGEHLRRALDAARRAQDAGTVERARRELGRVVRSAERTAESFRERAAAATIAAFEAVAEHRPPDETSLARLDELAAYLMEPDEPAVPVAPQPESPPAVAQSPAVAACSVAQSSSDVLNASIAALDALASAPLSDPVPIPEDIIVPIESLLYRGRAALDRAVEIRDEIREQLYDKPEGERMPELSELDELFDLLELARAE